MFKETKKSIKIYFIFVGILGLLIGLSSIGNNNNYIFGFIALPSLFFIYFGFNFYYYLKKSPKILIKFVFISFTINIIISLIDQQYFGVIIFILLGWYLIHNIKRISLKSN